MMIGQLLDLLAGVVAAGPNRWAARCPAHNDTQPSLSIATGQDGRILLKCHAGCSLAQITSALGVKVRDLFSSGPEQAPRSTVTGLTVRQLAGHKHLPEEFLLSLGLTDLPGGGVRIPYFLMDGSPAPRHRLRFALKANKGSRWTKGKGSLVPYGLHRLEDARKANCLTLVEGETDAWTLWHSGFPALGFPGADTVKKLLLAEYLEGIDKIYILQETDKGGKAFVRNVHDRLKALQVQK